MQRLAKTTAAIFAWTMLAACAADHDPPAEQRGTFVIDGNTVELGYVIADGERVFAGDIVLSTEDEAAPAPAFGSIRPTSHASKSNASLWPNATVPYTIEPDVSATHRASVEKAMTEWQSKTVIRFVKRAGEKAYLSFVERSGTSLCRANLGHVQDTRRFVYLRDTSGGRTPCNLGVVVHEIGHAIGLLHEHQRPDRGQYVAIDSACVPTGLDGAFDITQSGRLLGPYDITSTMHYRSTTLTKAGCYSIKAKNGSPLLHDWATLSAGDVGAVQELYGQPKPTPPPPAEEHPPAQMADTPPDVPPAATNEDDTDPPRRAPIVVADEDVKGDGCTLAARTARDGGAARFVPASAAGVGLALAALIMRRRSHGRRRR